MSEVRTNRLARETSPYLLQHQLNPVDWYPWGEEAFRAAREQNKPIFLSVGYSTCYWCHVMERQSFENDAVAKEMNDRFINIKVDREERPDVDQLYMTAVQILTRQGGWPMSVFLTPDLRPFYGGTYFPPTDMHGRPGFVSLLRGIDAAWRERPKEVEQTANQLVTILRGLAEPEGPESEMTIDRRFIDSLIERSTADYEPQFGGFGTAPKFPRETLLELLLKSQIQNPKSEIDKMLRHALDAMGHGGIRDQLGGGFHRYSTDAQWLVPHFEIMLYDNAMLAWCYVEAYRQTEELRYAKIARGICDFVLRELTGKDGAFFTALDAEVDGREGEPYLWTAAEVEEVLGKNDAELFNRLYGLAEGPNFADPHGGSGHGAPEKNVLFQSDPAAIAANEERLAPMRAKLKSARDQRKQPRLDDKIITSWNALMIRALAYAGQVFGEARYIDGAERAATHLLRHHRMPDGGLYRTRSNDQPKYAGFIDDYAYLIQALIALRDASGKEEWKDHAAALAIVMLTKFEDPDRSGFYFTESGPADTTGIIIRQKTASDSPLPSGNAVAAMALLELDQPRAAKAVLETFASQFDRAAESMSALVEAAHLYIKRFGPLRIAARSAPQTSRPAAPADRAREIVSLRTEWRDPTRLIVIATIQDGFHINAHAASPGLIATSLSVSAPDAKVEYPPGEKRKFAFADEAISVYEQWVAIAVGFAKPPDFPLTLRLTFQACSETACLQPVALTHEITRR